MHRRMQFVLLLLRNIRAHRVVALIIHTRNSFEFITTSSFLYGARFLDANSESQYLMRLIFYSALFFLCRHNAYGDSRAQIFHDYVC